MTGQEGGRPILVTGATGGQGGAVARACLARGIAVRAFVRDAASPPARALAAAGATLAVGDMADRDSVDRAMNGAGGVFSVQLDTAPVAYCAALVESARAAGVDRFVQSTVLATGLHESFPGWTDAGLWPEYWDGRHAYWTAKAAQETLVRAAGFGAWTILRPPMIVDNVIRNARWLFPRLASHGEILTIVPADRPVAYISCDSIGAAVATVLAAPERFAGVTLEIADEVLTDEALAVALGEGTGRPVRVRRVDHGQAAAMGLPPRIVSQQMWLSEIGYPARPEPALRYGLHPTPIAAWARRHRTEILIGG